MRTSSISWSGFVSPFIVRHPVLGLTCAGCYPAINVFDMETRKLRMVEDIHIHNMVDGLLAKGTEDYSVYQVCWTVCESYINTLTIV